MADAQRGGGQGGGRRGFSLAPPGPLDGRRGAGKGGRRPAGSWVLPAVLAALAAGALGYYLGYRQGRTQGRTQGRPQAAAPATAPAAKRTGDPRTTPAGPRPAGPANFHPRSVTAARGNYLENPDFAAGERGWKWLDWSDEWGRFAIDPAKGTGGTPAAHLPVRGGPADRPTKVFGVVQEIAPSVFPSRISGRYFVERWEPGGARKLYVQMVIISMVQDSDLPSLQIRYILEGVTEPPYNMSNARYKFVHRRTTPEIGGWVDFSVDVREDYRALWNRVPPDGTPFRVLFEARYDDKPAGGTLAADVYYDDLFVGVP